MTLLTFLLAFGLALRLTRLVTTDSISGPARLWVARKQGLFGWRGSLARWTTTGLACDWCVSVWASWFAFGTAYAWADTKAWVFLAGAAGAAYLVGLVQMGADWLSTVGVDDHDD